MADAFQDWYAFVGVARDASARDIARAYRRKALECHPDKRPGDAAAAREFETLQKAYEILGDEQARAAFDGVIAAREVRKRRHEADGARRQQLRTDLEQREAAVREAQQRAAAAGPGGAYKRARPAAAADSSAEAAAALDAERAARAALEHELARLRDAAAARQRAAAEARTARAAGAQPGAGGGGGGGATVALRWRAGSTFSAELLTALLRSVVPPRAGGVGAARGAGFTIAMGKRQALAQFDEAADARAAVVAWAGGVGGDGDGEDLSASTGISVELVGASAGAGAGADDADGGGSDSCLAGCSASAGGPAGGAAGPIAPAASGAPSPWEAAVARAGCGPSAAGGAEGEETGSGLTEYEKLTLMRLRQAGERQAAAAR